jgi:hypothetical protein
MKSIKFVTPVALILLSLLFSFTLIRKSGVQGKISPAEGIQQVLLILGIDTLKIQPQAGNFKVDNIKAGTYKLLIKAQMPYKDFTVAEVPVIDSAITDVGQIQLLQ